LNRALRIWIHKQSYNVRLSDSNEPGEGEHKILDFLRASPREVREGQIGIYGLDADLIMLGLIASDTCPHLRLLRERTEYNIEACECEYIYLKLATLKEYIVKDIGVHSRLGTHVVIHDYIFMCFLLGNDFVNHIPSLSLRYKGLDVLLRTYRSLQKVYQGYFHLIDIETDQLIQMSFFREFLVGLARHEPKLVEDIHRTRLKQSQRVISKYTGYFWKFQQSLGCDERKRTPLIPLQQLSHFIRSRDTLQDTEMAQEMSENLPLFFVKEEMNLLQTKRLYYETIANDQEGDETIHEVCQDFLDSVIWTTHYYFKGCVNWSWCTIFERGPLLRDLATYLQTKERLPPPRVDLPWTIPKQLAFIFPPQSHRLHSHRLTDKSKLDTLTELDALTVDVRFHRYLWEAHIIL
jgi:5'-3' exoribonuclease 2